MADVTIGSLPTAEELDDASLLPVEQQGQARALTGALLRSFALESGQAALEGAEECARVAQSSAQAAQAAQAAAETAAEIVENAGQITVEALPDSVLLQEDSASVPNLPPLGTSLEEASWAQIQAVANAGLGAIYWKVGGTKSVTVGEEAHTLLLIGFDHDDLTVPQNGRAKAGITFQLGLHGDGRVGMLDTLRTMSPSGEAHTNAAGWSGCRIRTELIPELLEELPEELQAVLAAVNKVTSAGNQNTELVTTSDKLFLLSESEVHPNLTNSAPGEGSQYAFYMQGNNRKRCRRYNGGMQSTAWWLRSPRADSATKYCLTSAEGHPLGGESADSYGVTFALCVGGGEHVPTRTEQRNVLKDVLGEDITGRVSAAIAGRTRCAANVVVGCTSGGWSAEDCHYLCTGEKDGAVLNAALQTLPDGGGSVLVLPGDYQIEKPVVLRRQGAVLSGKGAVFHRCWDPGDFNEGIVEVRAPRCAVYGLVLQGHKESFLKNYCCGVYIKCAEDALLAGLRCDENRMGIYLDQAKDCQVSRCVIKGSTNHGIYAGTCDYLSVQGCRIENGIMGMRIANSSQVTVTGCRLEGCRYSMSLNGVTDGSVTGNAIRGGAQRGLDLSNCKGMTVSGNSINRCPTGMYLANCSQMGVTGNVCLRGEGTTDDYLLDGHTIWLSGTSNRNVLVAGNVIPGKAVEVDGGTGNLTAHNLWGGEESA